MFLANNNEFKSLPREDSLREYNSRRGKLFESLSLVIEPLRRLDFEQASG
jgi:hypothetical protein